MTEQESSSGILKWVFGGLGIAGLAGSYLWAFTEELIPSPRELACLVSESFAEPAPGTRFTILISDLDGDSDSRQTKNVRASFLNQDGIHVIRTCRVLKLGSTAEATLLAERKGQRMLWDHNADLLIWGEVAKVDETLRLWFVRRDGGSTIGKSAYRLQNSVLPKDFDDDFAEQLIAVALASILPATEQAGTYLVDLLKPAAEKLERLSAHPPPNLLPEQRGQLHQAFGLASAVIGRQSGDADWLTKAVAAYRAALEERTRARAARLGDDPEQPRQRAPDPGRAGIGHGAPGGSGRGLSRGTGRTRARTRAAAMGGHSEQPGQRAQGPG
jgi:hypothetical protein